MIEILEQLKTYFIEMPVAMVGGTLMGIGLLSITISSLIYKLRAFTNKKAWNGGTLPSLMFGLFFLIIGGIIFFLDIYILRK